MRLGLEAQTTQARLLLEALAPDVGEDLAQAILSAPQETETEIVAQRERVGPPRGGARRARRGRTGPGRGPAPADARRHPGAQGRLDHRRRRLGLRHRLRRPRPRALHGPQRQHPRPRHRGVLEHRRPGVQGDAARRGGQVRRLRQGDRQEGPRRHRPVLRQRLRRPDLDGRQRPPDDQGAPRGRRLAGPVARHRLLDLHRPRHRHVQVDDPPEGRRPLRLLAAVPVPAVRGRARHPVQARLQEPLDPGGRLRRHRGPVRHPRPHPSRTCRPPRRTRPSRHRRAVALLHPARGDGAHDPPRADIEPEVASDAGYRTTRRRSDDCGPHHHLPRAEAGLADRRLGQPAHRRPRHRAGHRGRRRGGHRDAVAVRGGDPPETRSSSTGRSKPAPSTSPRRSTTSRRCRRSPPPGIATSLRWPRSRRRSTSPSSPASTPPHPADGSATPRSSPTPAPTPSS